MPIQGKPKLPIKDSPPSSQAALNLSDFSYLRLHCLKQEHEKVLIGEPLAALKGEVKVLFLSPAAGSVRQVLRGKKHAIKEIVIEKEEDAFFLHPSIKKEAGIEEKMRWMQETGLFPHIGMRPFDILAHPRYPPKRIFIKAIESAPFIPPPHLQIEGYEEFFQLGIDFLATLAQEIHLIYHEEEQCKAVLHAKNVILHAAKGPHPISSPSVHIAKIHPVAHVHDYVWTLDVNGVIAVGKMWKQGVYHTHRILGVGGDSANSGFYRANIGISLASYLPKEAVWEVLSGDPLMGEKGHSFLRLKDVAISIFKASSRRSLFHFLRLKPKQFTATKAYLSPPSFFTMEQHGEERAFIDSNIYDKVAPLNIPVVPFLKAALADEYPLMEKMGILEVSAEDFALPTFICPSKIEMVQIIKEALIKSGKEQFPIFPWLE